MYPAVKAMANSHLDYLVAHADIRYRKISSLVDIFVDSAEDLVEVPQ